MSARFAGYFLAGALPRLSMFIILFLLARMLDPPETGLFVLVITVGEIVEMTAGTWLRIYILKEEAGRPCIGAYRIGRLIALGLAMSLLAVVLSVPVCAVVAPHKFVEFAGATIAYIVAFSLLRHSHTLLQVIEAHTAFTISEIARSVLIFASALAGATHWPGSFLAPSLAVSGVTAGVALTSLAVAAPRLTRPRFSAAGIRPAFVFGAPIVADTILSLLIIHFDRFVLNHLLGPAAVGVYALAYALGRQPIEFLAGPLNTYALPVLFAGYNTQGTQRAREIQSGLCITLFTLCAAIFTGMLLLAEPIANVALKADYRPQAEWLMPTVTFAACLAVFKAFVFDNVFHMVQKNSDKMPSVVFTAVLGMGAAVLLVGAFGIPGAAASLVFSSVIGLAASVITSRRHFVFPVPLRRFASIALSAAGAGVALWLAARAAMPFGDAARIGAGFVAFCLVYAGLLMVQGISLRALASTPWAPLAGRAAIARSEPEVSAR